ncbi:MAG: DUF1398 family protein [Saprospiraceae bacterium]|nr:DUF1398 family protein [Candidatus Defluviibacterium haderslevense]
MKGIKSLGVTHYEAYVTDGHIDYHGTNDYTTKVPAKYEPLFIADLQREFENLLQGIKSSSNKGKTDFNLHQNVCHLALKNGAICMDQMTCTYYDKAGNAILVETIPQ